MCSLLTKKKNDIKLLKGYHTIYNLTNTNNKYTCSIEISGLHMLKPKSG